MLPDSDHDRARLAGAASSCPDLHTTTSAATRVRVLAPTQTGAAHAAALAEISILDETTLRSLTKSCRAVHDVTLLAPSHSVCIHHEEYLQQLAFDVLTLGQWVQTALVALRSAQRATSPGASAQPPSEAPTPARHARLLSPPATIPASSPAPEVPSLCSTTTAPSSARTSPRTSPHVQPPSSRPAATRSTAHVTVRLRCLLYEPDRPHPSRVRDALNKALGADTISSLRYSKDNNIILHPKAPYTVQQLLARRTDIQKCLSQLVCYVDDVPAFFDTGGTWSKLVIHHAPIPVNPCEPTAKQYPHRIFSTLVNDISQSNSIAEDTIRDLRLLCPAKEEKNRFTFSEAEHPHYESILFCIADDGIARRLLETGITIQGAHCRVTPYRPRR
ncbi:hypothetical protein EXIGLDRAFT_720324 [Exidia glandulosa HHB12029]|uniref:Uncharacterized protein n=1 Tax=Exidia glandulosa HHB12029 TaxID=1314781 RepID=A0A165GG24_EXIGL|nr:hypothetical protein EXIGLDRAFT_720324 [Exidia glandulosa HHB12029]